DSSVKQYFAISKQFAPQTWTIVTKDIFAPIVQGKGYHMNIEVLVNDYGNDQKSVTEVTPHVFILYEKKLRVAANYEVARRLEDDYERWNNRYEMLKEWIERYNKDHGPADVYYEDKYIVIYHLQREADEEKEREELHEKI